jgi:hypothetical protein
LCLLADIGARLDNALRGIGKIDCSYQSDSQNLCWAGKGRRDSDPKVRGDPAALGLTPARPAIFQATARLDF